MDVTGTIDSIGEETQVSDKFRKREFVLMIDHKTQYPQTILFELQQDRVDLIDPYKVGQEVSVSFNLKGRQWTSPQGEVKTFIQLVAWKIQSVNQ